MSDVRERVYKCMQRIVSKSYHTPPAENEEWEKLRLSKDIGFDSLDLVEFFIEIEHEFGIMIRSQDEYDIHTLGDVIEFVQQRTNKKALNEATVDALKNK